MNGSFRRVAPHEIFVFLGPTLAREVAEKILPARYLPPVSAGGILRALRLRPQVIAIVDGLFESAAAVWHKEILLAMEERVTVFGASSMGALRAAELAAFGMIGVGRIFEAYRDGVCTDDDEVAVLHAGVAGQYCAVSEAMVNIRATLARAVNERVIAPEVGDLVVARAKETFYQERSLKSAVEKARAAVVDGGELDRLLQFVENGGYVDQKKLDALELIQTLASLELPPAERRRTASRASRSFLLRTLQNEVMCRPLEYGQAWLPEEEKIALEASSLGPTYTLLCDLAQLLSLSDAVARARGIEPTRKATERVLDQDDFGLGPEARDPAWAATNDLDRVAFTRFVHRLARLRALLDEEAGGRRSREGWRTYLMALLRVHGEYERFRAGQAARGARRDTAVLCNLEQRDDEKLMLLRRMARLWQLVDRAAEARGVGTDGLDVELQTFADDFRAARGLDTRAATRAWLRRNDLDVAGFEELVTLWARLHILFHSAQTDTLGVAEIADGICWFHDALRLTGFYARLKASHLRGGSGKPTPPAPS